MSRYMQQIGWDDVPHISEKDKAEMLEAYPAHQRDARARGIPMLGSGAIYPIDETKFVVEPFSLPEWWPRAYGMDVGWKRTAAVWGAWDRDADILYLYSEHYQGKQAPQLHADGIKARGEIPGAIDPASAGSNQLDGRKLIEVYGELGLELYPADNAVEAGILALTRRLESGRLRVFSSLRNWLAEFRLYRRDEDGKIVKENDHLMDATRYLVMTGMKYARWGPAEGDDRPTHNENRDPYGGY